MSGGRLARFAPPLALGCALLALYGRALTRPFTSEDFLLIRYLSQNPPWHHLLAQLTAPWLGISVVKFYRPVSTLFYGIEIAAFGGHPLGYNLVHLLVHGANAGLIWAIARRLGHAVGKPGALTPWAIALLFAIYPLHPNAVVFSASFATLYGAVFLFSSVLAYQGFRESGSRRAWGASLALFVLALGSYEESAVLPALLVAYDHLIGVRVAAGRRHAGLALGYLPFFGVLGLYLLLRRWIFGVFVGGYDEYSQRLLAPQLRQMAHDLAASVDLLHLPVFDREPSPLGAVLGCLLLGAVPLAFWWLRRGSLASGHARLWLFAWAWTLAVQVPFAFRPCVPGNGRYWYLAAAGVAMSAVFLARGVFAAARPPWRNLAPAAVLLLAVVWADLLAGEVGTYIAAGRTARTIEGALLRAPGGPRLFLTRYPYFLENAARVPIAQVFHYGVWDAVQPPFVAAPLNVYPLPPLSGAGLLPVALGAPDSPIYEWEGGTRTIHRFALDPAERRPVEFQALGPAEGALVNPARDLAEVAVPPGPHVKLRLILSTRINGAVFDLDPAARVGERVRAPFPSEILQASDRLYGKGLHYWWIEARDAAGRVSGFSRMRSFRLAD